MIWSEKYRPTKIEQMVGNEEQRLMAIRWLAKWVKGTKPLLLVGPPGTGKTTLAQLLALEFDYDLVSMNASDTRNKDSLRERILPILSNTTNLLGKKIMLFLDEVDGISGREDSGGLDALVEMLKEPTVPVIMAANEKSTKIKDLAKVSKAIEFDKIPSRELLMFVNHVLATEQAELSLAERNAAIESSSGDVRAALNSVQSRAAGYQTESKDQSKLEIGDALNSFFASPSKDFAQKALAMANSSFPDPRYEGMSPDTRRRDLISALFSSIVSSYPERNITDNFSRVDDLAQMLDLISRADVLVGRAGMNREWRLLKYVLDVLSGLYNLSRNAAIKYNQYSMPWPLMGPMFARGQTSRKLLGTIAPHYFMSKSEFGSITLPYLLQALESAGKDIDLQEFALYNFGDESVGDSLAKAMEKVAR